jgi:hypothetical protein
MRNLKILVIAFAVAATALTGCSSYNDSRGKGDAPIGKYDDAPVFVRNQPDGFQNVAFSCIGLNGVYTTTREAAPVVIADDPNCSEGGFFDELGLLDAKIKSVDPEGTD